jgi:DNA-binding IclR family transcriptional regulator
VKKNPGIRANEIAKTMGVPPSQAYALARRLQDSGQIRKRGKGYAVK